MKREWFEDTWKDQSIAMNSGDSLRELIRKREKSEQRTLTISSAIAIAAICLGIFNFYGQFVVNGDALLVSLLRALPVLVAIPIHLAVTSRLNKEHRERAALADDHRKWLTRWVADLENEAKGRGVWKLALFSSFVIAVVATTKWLDYQSGADSLAECIGITLLVASIFAVIGVAVWHYQTQFLVPEHLRYRRILGDLDAESETPA